MDAELEAARELALNRIRRLSNITRSYGSKWLAEELERTRYDPEAERLIGHPLMWLLSAKEPEKERFDAVRSELAAEANALRQGLKPKTEPMKNVVNLLWLDGCRRPLLELEAFDSNLGQLSGYQRLNRSVKKTKKNPEQFYDTVPEIMVAAAFDRKGALVEIEPNMLGKNPDLQVELDGLPALLEIVTPRLPKKLQESDGRVVEDLPDRFGGARGIIAQKVSQLSPSMPGILVVNNEYGGVMPGDLEDAIEGEPLLEITRDTRRGGIVGMREVRDDNGIQIIPESKRLSALIQYKPEYELMDDSIVATTSLTPIEQSAKPLSQKQMAELRQIFADMKYVGGGRV